MLSNVLYALAIMVVVGSVIHSTLFRLCSTSNPNTLLGSGSRSIEGDGAPPHQ